MERIAKLAVTVIVAGLLLGSDCGEGNFPGRLSDRWPASELMWLSDNQLVFDHWGHTYIVDADGSQVENLTTLIEQDVDVRFKLDHSPTISPDGMRLAFSTYGHDVGFLGERFFRSSVELGISNLDGTDFRILTDTPGIDRRPAWSPDGREIAFVSGEEGGPIAIIAEDGSGGRNVTQPGDIEGVMDLAWFPNGERLAFAHLEGVQREGFWSRRQILNTIAVDGSDLKRIGESPMLPAWSQNGHRMAYALREGDWLRFYVADGDGSNAVALPRLHWRTSFPQPESIPLRIPVEFREFSGMHWTPDGSAILVLFGYVVDPRRETYVPPDDLWAVPTDGSDIRGLGWSRANGSSLFAVSPNGTRIAVLSPESAKDVLYTMALDGSDQRVLVKGEGIDDLVAAGGVPRE